MSRVAITGLSMTSCLGLSLTDNWNHICGRISGISECNSRFIRKLGQLPEGFSSDFSESHMKYTNTIHGKLLMVAAIEALNHSNYFPHYDHQQKKIGISESLMVPDFQDFYMKTGAFTACNVASAFDLKGPVTTSGSGIQAIVEACQMIRNEEVDMALALGSSVELNDSLLNYLTSQGILKSSENGQSLVPSEGSAGILLESLKHAKERNAKIYAEIELHSHTEANEGNHIDLDGEVVFSSCNGLDGARNCIDKWSQGKFVMDIKKNIGWVPNADGINDVVIATLMMSQGIVPPLFDEGKLKMADIGKTSILNFTWDSSAWHLMIGKVSNDGLE